MLIGLMLAGTTGIAILIGLGIRDLLFGEPLDEIVEFCGACDEPIRESEWDDAHFDGDHAYHERHCPHVDCT